MRGRWPARRTLVGIDDVVGDRWTQPFRLLPCETVHVADAVAERIGCLGSGPTRISLGGDGVRIMCWV